MRRSSTVEQLGHAVPFFAAAARSSCRARRAAVAARASRPAGSGTAMWLLEQGQHQLRVARLQRGEQLAMLVHHPWRGPGRGRSGRSTRGSGARSSARSAPCGSGPSAEITISWKRRSASTCASRSSACGRLLHQPHLLAELGEVLVGHPVERVQEAVALEREPDRDQDLLHLLVRDAEHDGAAVGERHHEALVLELPQRLAHRAAARAELASRASPRSGARRARSVPMMIALRRISTTCCPRGRPCRRRRRATTAGVRSTLSAMVALHHRNCRQSPNG